MFENINKQFDLESFDFDFEAANEQNGILDIELEKLKTNIIDNFVNRNRQFKVSFYLRTFVFGFLHLFVKMSDADFRIVKSVFIIKSLSYPLNILIVEKVNLILFSCNSEIDS